jgi:L,D-transpeptidase catalytic domain
MRIEPASEAAAPARLGVCLSRSPTTIEYSPIFDPLPPDFKRLDVPMAKQLWLTGLRGMTHMVPGFARGRTRGSSARSRDTRAKILAAACAVWLLAPPFAYAQFPFWPQRGFWPGQYGGHGHKHHHRHTKPELTKEARPEAPPTDPLEIIVSIADQRVSLYENGALVTRSPVSTGTKRHPTPVGIFNVLEKQRWHRSNIYSGAPMPYMQRITWSGIALHAGVVPGHPASHGCIRLTSDFATRLWPLTKRGTRVIIARDDVQPVEIANPHLFRMQASSLIADADNGASTAEVTHDSLASGSPTEQTAAIRIQGTASASAVARKIAPVSVFISRRLGKLFVRQGVSSLFETPVRIENPEAPIGTHVFTAIKSRNDEADVRWIVVSMPSELPRVSGRSAKKREKPVKQAIEASPPAPSSGMASAALERIEIPQDAIERISALLTPAASLIISDNGFSHETRKDTDFIVVMH